MNDLKKKDIVYFARIIPSLDIYEIYELIVRTVEPDFFVGVDKRDKRAYLFGYDDINKIIFKDRFIALKVVNEAAENRTAISKEKYYEEY